MSITLDGIDTTSLPLTHLRRLTDDHGLLEHALGNEPRLEHGYCLDDAARALEFTVREWAETHSPEVVYLAHLYMSMVERAIAKNGSAHNRMDGAGEWTDQPAGGDWWGRAVCALGVATAVAPDPAFRTRAAAAFRRASAWESPDLRAQLYASIGAAEALHSDVFGLTYEAHAIIASLPATMSADATVGWLWPEPRLRYANGAIPEALIAVGEATEKPHMVRHGLALLDLLLRLQVKGDHLSVIGQEGWAPGEKRVPFDQQAIEVVALANACVRAWAVTGQEQYRDAVALARLWFLGDNDSGTPMVDLDTGAGFDGLTPTGRNLNQGAESTLAALTTFQAARRCGLMAPA